MATELEFKISKDTTKYLGELKTLKSNNDKAGFNALLYGILAPVRKYVKHEIKIAEIKSVIPENNYEASEIMDDLMIRTFDSIENIDAQQQLLSWLFQQSDLMLEDLYVEEEFNSFFYKNIDDLSRIEQDAMEEIISRDADGDLVLVEEIDDMSYSNYEYVLNDIFVTNPEKSLIEDIDSGMVKEKVKRSIAKMIRFLPNKMRNIYNLHHHGLDADSIAFIKRIPTDSVNTTIHKVKRTLRHLLAFELDQSKVYNK